MNPTARRRRPIILFVLTVAAVTAAAIWWFFLRDDSPARFDIDDAVGSLEQEETDDAAPAETADSTSTSTAALGADGVWTVDPDEGAETGGSEAGFRVAEELATVGATEAVGRTSEVLGEVRISGTTVSDVEVTVDLASLRTDDTRRDNRVRQALATDEFPSATFELTEPVELDAIPAEGETINVTAEGELTIKGVTNPVEVTVDAQRVDETLVVVGSMPVVFADFDVQTPTAALVVSVADQGTIEFQLFLTR